VTTIYNQVLAEEDLIFIPERYISAQCSVSSTIVKFLEPQPKFIWPQLYF